MEFLIGSANKAKVAATQEVLSKHFPNVNLSVFEVDSGVSNQPFGDSETKLGAVNRASAAADSKQGAIGIGLEGGVRILDNEMYLCNWGALVLADGTIFTAGGAQIPLPREVADAIYAGGELGPVVDSYFKDNGIRQREGAMGMFTAHCVTRKELFEHILQLLVGQLIYSGK